MQVEITTSLGTITLALYPETAPKTVENFSTYLNNDFYTGTIFHRVIKDFMIQGGGLDKDMHTKPTNDAILNEADNGLSNEYASVAMARTAAPHSATAQFFINTNDNPFLDFRSKTKDGWGYCVFGKVIAGMDIVTLIEEKETITHHGFEDVPRDIIEIQKTRII